MRNKKRKSMRNKKVYWGKKNKPATQREKITVLRTRIS